MDGSKRSGHGNAYFTGFGRHKRIVFFDTLLKGLNTDEVIAVLAHEVHAASLVLQWVRGQHLLNLYGIIVVCFNSADIYLFLATCYGMVFAKT